LILAQKLLKGSFMDHVTQHHLQKLGLTRTSKPILDLGDIDSISYLKTVQDFSLEDHFDAFCLLEFLCSREIGRLGSDSVQCLRYSRAAALHYEQIPVSILVHQKAELSLITIFDLIKFGKSRADHVFID
jgi:hypothetical protein